MKKQVGLAVGLGVGSTLATQGVYAEEFPLHTMDAQEAEGQHYVPSTVDNVRWGELPNRTSAPVLKMESGETITFDTVSAEGLLDDQGRDPVSYFGQYGVKPKDILSEAIAIAESDIVNLFGEHGPHIVTGPVEIKGAEPGDVLKVETLSLTPRVPYGVISNRHGRGALPGEFPENEGPAEEASVENPEWFHNVSVFTPITMRNGQWYGEIPGEDVFFPLQPFMGMMGVATDTTERVDSVPPTRTGGNIDINDLGVGSTLYLPIEVEGGLFYTGDPHFSQGDGEVALSALEGSLRVTFRLSLLKKGDPGIPGNAHTFTQPIGETEDYWLPIGLDEDLNEAMKDATRQSIDFLEHHYGMDRAKALAYLSAATDFEVSQVVDRTKGINGKIRKADFEKRLPNEVAATTEGGQLPQTSTNYVAWIIGGLSVVGAAFALGRRKKRSV
ncbi:acetamidase/formamidase family protein [Shouchella miscanthi]|uniref:Acetamidase/formamidase family protein n=1 Tax=Shouchella miscanthi TaxID=2598861 RepID=A0ABU6NN03_9BACI|nr:acetamidase/formamidase family protein [Shouchella miscanthi]MED4128828.1 acetamidase/formamidase family protein [Shouchella miscanthi]